MTQVTHLKLQIGDAEDELPGGHLQNVDIDLSGQQWKKLTDDQVMEQYLIPAMRQLVREARNLKAYYIAG